MTSEWDDACDPVPARWKPSKSTLWRRERRMKRGRKMRLNGHDPKTSISDCIVDPDFDEMGA